MRSRYLPTWVLLFSACSVPPAATNQQGCTTTPATYSDLKAPDGGVVVVCGTPGSSQQAAFSYVDCQPGGAGLCPFCDPVAVGGTATIYIDSPFNTVASVTSSDPHVATFAITPAAGEKSVVQATGLAAGETTLSLLDAHGTVIDEASVKTAQPDTTSFTSTPISTTLELLSGATTTVCGTPMSNGAPAIGPQLIGGASLGGASLTSVPPVGVDTFASFWGVPFGVCYDVAVAPGKTGSIAVWGPGTAQAWQLADVEPDASTAIAFSPSSLTVPSTGWGGVTVTVTHNGVPIVGGLCDWSAPENLSVSNFSSPGELPIGALTLGTEAETVNYLVTAQTATTGTFWITCKLANGNLAGTIEVTVTP